MISITLVANFLPKVKKFKVEIKTPERRWVELMTVSRFLRLFRDGKVKPLKIGGVTVNMSGDGTEQTKERIFSYFKQVADAYIQTYYK